MGHFCADFILNDSQQCVTALKGDMVTVHQLIVNIPNCLAALLVPHYPLATQFCVYLEQFDQSVLCSLIDKQNAVNSSVRNASA